MKRIIIAGLAMAASAPLVAQTSTSPNVDATATPSAPATAAPAAPAAAAPSDPASIIRTEFPAYDKDASGTLDKMEMATWLKALRTAAPNAKPMAPADETKWLDTSFRDADSDKSASVTLAELTTYLTRGS